MKPPPPENKIAELKLYWACALPLLCQPTPWVREQAQRWLGWLPPACHQPTAAGFTLAELLISLAILGLIATFTIPKILNTMQNTSNNAKAKEAAALIAGAFQKAQLDGIVTATTKPADLIPYMNYVSIDTTATIDVIPGYVSSTCSPMDPCVTLHNGSVLQMRSNTFTGTTPLNTIEILFDPDFVNNTTSTADGPLKSIKFYLYYNGLITTNGNAKTNSCSSLYCPFNANPALDPSWFSW